MLGVIFLLMSVVCGYIFWQKKLPRNRWFKPAAILFFILGVGFSGHPSWIGFLLPIAAVGCGLIAGHAWAKYKTVPTAMLSNYLVITISAIIWLATAAIVMQPEYFQFGRMGYLTVFHLVFLIAIAMIAPFVISMGIFTKIKREKTFLNAATHKHAIMLLRLLMLLGLLLFAMTESVLMFLMISVISAAIAGVSGGHLLSTQTKHIPDMLFSMWLILLGLFGIITILPVLTIVAILLWVANTPKNLWKNIRELI